jgi:hypothetical protein
LPESGFASGKQFGDAADSQKYRLSKFQKPHCFKGAILTQLYWWRPIIGGAVMAAAWLCLAQ